MNQRLRGTIVALGLVYDGVYLALAVALEAPLVTADRRPPTADRRLARALRGSELAGRVVDVESLP